MDLYKSFVYSLRLFIFNFSLLVWGGLNVV